MEVGGVEQELSEKRRIDVKQGRWNEHEITVFGLKYCSIRRSVYTTIETQFPQSLPQLLSARRYGLARLARCSMHFFLFRHSLPVASHEATATRFDRNHPLRLGTTCHHAQHVRVRPTCGTRISPRRQTLAACNLPSRDCTRLTRHVQSKCRSPPPASTSPLLRRQRSQRRRNNIIQFRTPHSQ